MMIILVGIRFANIKVIINSCICCLLDHRANQDQAQYDVYLAKSTDRGLSFSTNIKINDISIPNVFVEIQEII